jgi:hypothetical protein
VKWYLCCRAAVTMGCGHASALTRGSAENQGHEVKTADVTGVNGGSTLLRPRSTKVPRPKVPESAVFDCDFPESEIPLLDIACRLSPGWALQPRNVPLPPRRPRNERQTDARTRAKASRKRDFELGNSPALCLLCRVGFRGRSSRGIRIQKKALNSRNALAAAVKYGGSFRAVWWPPANLSREGKTCRVGKVCFLERFQSRKSFQKPSGSSLRAVNLLQSSSSDSVKPTPVSTPCHCVATIR